MDRRKEGMDHRVEVFMANGGEHLQPHAVILQLAWGNVMRPPVHCNLVTTCYQPGRKVFREGFESAVARWNTTRSENNNAHKLERCFLDVRAS
jgi:hypothetical protein